MSFRYPLKPGSIVKMPNQGQYIVGEKIGQGGLSLIYAGKTKANGYPIIIKEFFPSEHAHRAEKTVKNSDGSIAVRKGQVCPDDGYEQRFERCLKAFEQEGRLGSCAHRSNFQIISFSDCGSGYAILPRWSSDTCSFYDLVNSWKTQPPVTTDRFFKDLGRVRFALAAISSLLSALASIHGQGMLHLDISSTNVVWSGHSRLSPENGVAFLTDFGCSVLMSDGAYPTESVLSYSREYAAPEYARKDGSLNQTTDIYSVGQLLRFLCFGQRGFYTHSILQNLVDLLHIPVRCRQGLLSIIEKATAAEMSRRYQSAAEMQASVQELLASIPLHPITPDNSTDFSLYSLKSMLEGSLDTHYSWAQELCDRRGENVSIPETVHMPLTDIPGGHFADDTAFLRAILPEEVFQYLQEQISKEVDSGFCLNSVMTGTYSKDWKDDICRTIHRYGTRRLLEISRSLLRDERTFAADLKLLFQLMGSDGKRLANSYYNCAVWNESYIGLALLIVYALLGADGFGKLLPSPADAAKLFMPI